MAHVTSRGVAAAYDVYMGADRSPGPGVSASLPVSAYEAARAFLRDEAKLAWIRHHAERALALALRRYLPESERMSDREVIEDVARRSP